MLDAALIPEWGAEGEAVSRPYCGESLDRATVGPADLDDEALARGAPTPAVVPRGPWAPRDLHHASLPHPRPLEVALIPEWGDDGEPARWRPQPGLARAWNSRFGWRRAPRGSPRLGASLADRDQPDRCASQPPPRGGRARRGAPCASWARQGQARAPRSPGNRKTFQRAKGILRRPGRRARPRGASNGQLLVTQPAR